MSDPPPKPKVGSLRDRIAAFEKGGASASGPAPAPAPAPRPKPGGLQWKPKQPTPPDSPSAAPADVSSSARSGMNASDAKASIGMGGSLKDRMAALQKGGAFGSPAPPTAPKPAVEKPKWKPPPKVVPVDKDEDGDDNQGKEARSLQSIVGGRPSSEGSFKKVEDPAGEKAEGGDDEKEGDDAAPAGEGEEQPAEEAAEPDPEEEERQRRAALAARMAKLGGTRVGMAPMFGGGARPPPVAKKPKRLSTQEEPAAVKSSDEGEPKQAEEHAEAPSPPAEKPQPKRQASTHSQVSLEPTPDRQDSVGSDASQARSPPTSMPMPTVARRAGPPRKKAVKSPEPATPPVVTSPEAGLGTDPLDKAGEEIKSTDFAGPPQEAGPEVPKKEERNEEPETSGAMPPPPDKEELKEVLRTAPIATRQTSGYISDNEDNPPPVPEREEAPVSRKTSLEAEKEDIPVPHEEPIEEPPLSPSPVAAQEIVEEPKEVEPEPEAQPEELDEEAEEAARRKRIAEKMGKMGGINPLALSGGLRGPTSPPLPHTSPPPPRRQSTGRSIEEALPTSPPPPPLATKPASRKSSMDIPTSPPPVAPKPPSRKGSIVEEEEDDETFTRAQAPADDIPQDIDRDFSDDEGINQSHETRPDVNTYHLDSDDRAPSPVSEEEITPSADDLTPGEGPAAAITPIQETSPPPPPLPNKATRPPSQQINLPPPPPPPVRPPSEDDKHHAPPARNLPPPPPARFIPQLVEDADDEGNESDLTRSNYSEQGGRTSPGQAQPPPISSREPSDNEDDAPPRHVPFRQASQGNRYDEDADDDDSEPAVPVPHRDPQPVKKTGGHPRPPFRAVPLSPASSQGGPSDVESSDGEALQIPPRRRPDSPSGNNLPLVVPPPRIEAVEPSPLRQSHRMFERDEELEDTQDLELDEDERGRHESGKVKRSTDHLSPPPRGGEVLDEDEGDPIDPGFHSPPSRRTSTIGLSAPAAPISPPPPAVSPPTQEKTPSPPEEPVVDEEQARRQTIAERMARLGGIKFGAAPPMAPRRAAPQAPPEDEGSPPAEEQDAAEPVEVDEEEEERARKERIAAKLAGMGGMRIGMMPMGLSRPPQPPPRVTPENAPPAPPSRAPPGRPPPPPQHQESESDFDDLAASQPSLPASDDGVHVEAMESEIEEGYEDINESEPEDEVPPPIPDRGARRRGTGSESTEVPPPLPPGRPPVPVIPAIRKSSGQTTTPAGRKSSVESGRDAQTKPTLKSQQSEYVMVEEPAEYSDDVPPPLPPGRHTQARSPPTRSVPAPGPPARTSVDKQWDLGSSIEFSDTPDLALSWTEANDPLVSTQASTSYPPPPPPAREMPPAPPSHLSQPPIAERHYSADDLIAIWGRVGVQVCEVATALYEKSKKALIGDGTYEGFVHAVLSEVPNALIPQPPGHLEYGFVIYAQTGNTVQKRVNEVMPGDVVEIHDAKFKGHKGLQGYTQNIERLVGVVSEYEPKKSKVRVFQANQHVGHQTVEAVSYRFDDLKSGSVKIYRVLEN